MLILIHLLAYHGRAVALVIRELQLLDLVHPVELNFPQLRPHKLVVRTVLILETLYVVKYLGNLGHKLGSGGP